jgi:hypothetical protein
MHGFLLTPSDMYAIPYLGTMQRHKRLSGHKASTYIQFFFLSSLLSIQERSFFLSRVYPRYTGIASFYPSLRA